MQARMEQEKGSAFRKIRRRKGLTKRRCGDTVESERDEPFRVNLQDEPFRVNLCFTS